MTIWERLVNKLWADGHLLNKRYHVGADFRRTVKHSQSVHRVERPSLYRGTAHFPICSHDEEDDLMESKNKLSFTLLRKRPREAMLRGVWKGFIVAVVKVASTPVAR